MDKQDNNLIHKIFVDGYLDILKSVLYEEKTVEQICSELKTPSSTGYRRIKKLLKYQLLLKRYTFSDGRREHKTMLLKSKIRLIKIEIINDDEIKELVMFS